MNYMNQNKKLIWAFHSMKKGIYDNDYYFYDDGSILHHYDRTLSKLDIEEYVSASEIPDSEKEKIISRCEEECSLGLVNWVKTILQMG